MKFLRGGNPEVEQRHGKLLLEKGASETWGWGTPAGKRRVQRRAEWLSCVCNLTGGVMALECGCGTGLFTRELVKSGAFITGVDISTDLLDRARKECSVPNVRFVQDNLEEPLHLEDAAYDTLCGVSVLHHLDVPKALDALRRKMKPGARFAFSEPNILNPINKYYMFVDDMEKRRQRGISPGEMAFTPSELRGFFEQAGYVVEGLAYRDFLHPSTPVALIPLVDLAGRIVEQIPFLQRWSGSLWIWGHL
jgi:SAM-dependent methyltransferase